MMDERRRERVKSCQPTTDLKNEISKMEVVMKKEERERGTSNAIRRRIVEDKGWRCNIC